MVKRAYLLRDFTKRRYLVRIWETENNKAVRVSLLLPTSCSWAKETQNEHFPLCSLFTTAMLMAWQWATAISLAHCNSFLAARDSPKSPGLVQKKLKGKLFAKFRPWFSAFPSNWKILACVFWREPIANPCLHLSRQQSAGLYSPSSAQWGMCCICSAAPLELWGTVCNLMSLPALRSTPKPDFYMGFLLLHAFL